VRTNEKWLFHHKGNLFLAVKFPIFLLFRADIRIKTGKIPGIVSCFGIVFAFYSAEKNKITRRMNNEN